MGRYDPGKIPWTPKYAEWALMRGDSTHLFLMPGAGERYFLIYWVRSLLHIFPTAPPSKLLWPLAPEKFRATTLIFKKLVY